VADQGPAGEAPPVLDPEQQQAVAANCFDGQMPRAVGGPGSGPTEYVYRRGYVLEHSSTDRIPVWVCERVAADHVDRFRRPTNEFLPDDQLSAESRARNEDYAGTCYQRGHMAAAGNQKDDGWKRETFFLSNCAPQRANFNLGVWHRLEDGLRDWVRSRGGHVHVISGGFFDPAGAPGDGAAAAAAAVEYEVLHERVSVPTHFFKVVIWSDDDDVDGRPRVDAFVFKHEPSRRRLGQHRVDLEEVERRTGLSFLPRHTAGEKGRMQAGEPKLVQWLDGNR
jgi:endonuclease G